MDSEKLEREARTALLASLARSLQALARVLESIADIGEYSPETAKLLRDNMHSLTAMQKSITELIAGLDKRKRARRSARPGEPWLQPWLRL